MKIVLAGAHGFVARYLQSYFAQHQLVLLTRNPGPGEVYWDPEKEILDPRLVADADVVINVAGESITGYWTQEKLRRIAESRYQATRVLLKALKSSPPLMYVGASAIGCYGAQRGDETLTESSSSGAGILAPICQAWEHLHQELKGSRIILARFGVVVGRGGLLARLKPAFRLGLGAVLGSGEQWMSWISIEDVGPILEFCIQHAEIQGALNITAPYPVTNAQWTSCVASTLHRPVWLRLPQGCLRILGGKAAYELALGSLYVLPEKLLQHGYTFQFPRLSESLLQRYL